MRSLVNGVLGLVGFELRRVAPQRAEKPYDLDPEEIEELERLLRDFAESRPENDALARADELRQYLSDRRIAFFNELVRLTRALGVELSQRRVADVGCGMGYLLRRVDQLSEPSALVGYDTFAAMNELARMLCPSASVHDLTIHEIDETFDVVFCTEVLEHLVDPAAALHKMVACLSPEGALVVTVPDGRLDRHAARAMREDGSAYWGHIHFWSPESWPLFLKASLGDQFRIQTERMDSEKNLGVIRRVRPGG